MDCFSSTIQEYQPILIGAGCLAFGYMYGRHCRSVMENPIAAPTVSDAACCAGTESFNYIPEPDAAAMVDPETMAIVRQWLNPAEADWDSSDRELTEKPERCAKRDLEVLPRKKEDMIWNHNVSKKQKSAPAVMREVVRTKPESDQDSDDELLAQRLEFFTKSLSGTRASINNKKKKKPSRANEDRHDTATSCEETKNVQEITAKKGVARSLSGLGALASPQQEDDDDDDEQGESFPGSSVEDTCRSPKTIRLGDGDDDDEEEQDDEVLHRSCQVELVKKCTPETEAVALFRVSCTLSNTLHQLVGDSNMSVSLMESKDHTGGENEGGECANARMEVDDAQNHVESAGVRLELPTSPPPELLLLHGKEEGKGVGEGDAAAAAAPVPVIDKGMLLHAEIYKRLQQLPKSSAADNYEKRSKISSSCFFGATTKPVRFRWLNKLTSSWRKRSKLWRHRYNSYSNSNSNNKQLHKQAALPAAPAETSQSGLPEMANSCGAPEGTLSAECCNF